MSDRPNIVFFHVDNLGLGELGCYGGGILRGADTARIDAFSDESIKLSHYVVEPQCTPTRSALLTGRYPIRSGNHTIALGGNDGGLVAWERTLGDILSEAGYATSCVGKWHVGDQIEFLPTHRGFDHYLGFPYSNDMGGEWDGSPQTPPAKRKRRVWPYAILLLVAFTIGPNMLEGSLRNWSIIYMRDSFFAPNWVDTLTLPVFLLAQSIGRLNADRLQCDGQKPGGDLFA